jgi:transposase
MPKRLFSDDVEREMANLYRQGMPAHEIATKFGCKHEATIFKALTRQGVKGRGWGYGKRPAMIFRWKERIPALWNEGLSVNEIAKQTGLMFPSVKIVLRACGIEPIPRVPSRKRHVNWNGGRYINDHGYVEVMDDDPHYASMRGSDGYTPEHRLVMARSLKRPLKRYETVHHIDGNRQNNVLGNLELRQGKHGNGVRFVCLDCGSHNIKAVELHRSGV